MTQLNDWKSILAAYQKGLTADMLQIQINGEWGVIWTVPSCSPSALELAARQFSRSRTQNIRYTRRAILKTKDGKEIAVVIFTELQSRQQIVMDLATATKINVARFLADEAMNALLHNFTPFVAIRNDTQKSGSLTIP